MNGSPIVINDDQNRMGENTFWGNGLKKSYHMLPSCSMFFVSFVGKCIS
jgi:hypothetical protein